MRKHGGPPSRRDKHVTLAAISPPGVARGRFVGGQQSGLAGCKPPPLFTRGASSCSSQGRRQGEPWGASPRPSAPTYLPTCVLGLELRLRPATPGWGVGVCVCMCARSACTPTPLARVCGLGVRALTFVSAVPRHSWLECWGVCVCLCARPTCTPPPLTGVCGVVVCAWAWVAAAPRHSWLQCWGVCVVVCALCLYPATPGCVVRCGDVCLGSDFGCTPPHLAGVSGCVCVSAQAPLVPRHSWLGCAVRACVLGLGFRLSPASPGWGVGVCVCLSARSACTPPLLAGVCRVRVSAWARVSASPRHSWLGRWGVCVFVCALRFYSARP